MYRIKGSYVVGILMSLILAGCQNQVEHTAPAIRPQDSVAMMTSYGVNTLVSDSGVMKYRIVTERWEVNTSKNPSLWIFDKGLLLEQFDEKFHINSYIQCDTAYYYDQQKIWKLYGRVSILTKDGLRFNSEQLTWDQNKHELSSNVFSKLVTPERTLQGSHFWSDEKMTRYYVSNSKGIIFGVFLPCKPVKKSFGIAGRVRGSPLVLYGFGYILGWFLSLLFLPFHRLALPA